MTAASPFLPAVPAAPASRIPRVLTIAGSDPSGGAGIQADLKSIAAHGGYGMAAITALTAQNTRGVSAIHVPPADFLTAQLDAVSADIRIDAVKIGMLGDAAVIDAVRTWLAKVRPAIVVLDPVMVATSGDRLLQAPAESALQELLPYADLITPNLAELAILLNEPVAGNWAAALEQGKRLAAGTGTTVLVKGGHLDGTGAAGGAGEHGDGCPDALVNTCGVLARDVIVVPGERVRTSNSHGTGCSLSAAMATVQARVGDWEAALREVKPWLEGALRTSADLDVGSGNGPVHHFHHVQHQTAHHGTGAGGGELHRVPAAGEFARGLRETAAADLEAIYGLDFITALADGSLPEQDFAYYLGQDALYLNGYSRVLSRAAAIAPTEDEQLFWTRSAQNCLSVEAELHRTWLRGRTAERTLGPVTKSYVDHLLAASVTGSYGVLIAAVLPCFWLYAEVGQALHNRFLAAGAPESHPYAAWLRTYADPEFADATRQAIAHTDTAARAASPGERDAMTVAFRQSARYEVDFFDAPRVHA
ncbi:bifunctional hydroxymethylpyrimidine kinase/phosphomethylpyrimidine kinase [Arthrobacter sp. AL08]|uniref:bifunctional hydroxymethylpyrimidine kinase/phosphomethylpyrimidine kinase n=1 Tax=unclassified Arthrobacter TaxID=235627 RepID=UPI00249A8FF5|nr:MULTISPECIES: bifunctional hydroxymethylpyrimidine kinase/phosphomethylpyrimidine kinase [unclassified Arthrobacter]MDI3242369.1 bifunctional hydroxymethylpyrimidine kinase/phosphomethylpyrimidine kinase [Arthrobacter sp. AL05]MDI3278379.1 bifunctional hydroxymethylpyrimidine kinase/phosphomethylpyrimidine kinase [Arthrobacter sp. AL08]